MNIRELLIRIGVNGTQEAGRQVTNLDHKVDQLKGSFNNLGGAIAGLFGAFSLGAIVHAADEMQTLEFRTGQVAQSQGTAAQAFDQVAAHATDARVSIEAYTEAYAGIGAATHDLVHDQSDLLNITDTVSKGLQLAGANTQQTSSVMSQLTQAISIQKLQWEDLKVIMQNSDAFAVRLAKSLGMSLSEMIKATQGQGGGIGADKIIKAIRDMSGEVAETFKTMPMTISQARVVISNQFDMIVNRFNRASGAVSMVANNIVNAMNYIEHGVNVLTEALGGAENAVRILSVVLGAAGLVGALKALQFGIGFLFSPIGLLIGGLAALFLIGQDVFTWLKGGPSVLGDMIGPASDFKDGIDGISQALTDLKNMAVATLHALNGLADFFNSTQDWGADLGAKLGTDKLAGWLKEKAGWLADDLGQWGSYFNDKTFGAFDLPQMWGDSQRGLAEYNGEKIEQRKREIGFSDSREGDSKFSFAENDGDKTEEGNNYQPLTPPGSYSPQMKIPNGYEDSGVSISSPTVTGAPVNNVTVHIGTIDASNTDAPDEAIRGAAKETFTSVFSAPAGYGRTLGDSLTFAGGSK